MASTKRAIIYTRVSTGKQADSGLSLTDQEQTITPAVEARGWTVVHHATDEGISVRSLRKRPGLTEALDMLVAGKADVLVSSHLTRLARSVVDLGGIMGRAERHGWDLIVLDVGVHTGTAAGRMMLNAMGSFSQFESEIIGQRAAMTHRQRWAKGQWSGQAPELADSVRHRVARLRADGMTLQAIADQLTVEEVPTARGGRWYPSTIRAVVASVALDDELAAKRAAA
ncbi:MAG: recombinase family protein [Acidimicrobiales bacterium]